VPDLVIQPTKKWVRLQYWTVFTLLCVAVGVWVNVLGARTGAVWVAALPAVLFVFPIRGHILQHFTKITISGDKLRYETGVLSKTMRSIQISKVQNVRCDQTLGQRLMRIGHVSIETAGETSTMTIPNVDNPQAVVEALVDMTPHQPPRQKGDPE
jgi:uncharacterized membrane protein YdbT with pleckstrin-like domain